MLKCSAVGLLSFVFFSSFGIEPSRAQFPGPPLPNPYCGIPTYVYDAIGPRAQATMVPPGTPLILVKSSSAMGDPRLLSFMLAHECGHHARGHVIVIVTNPMAAMLMQPQQELEADCWAALILRQRGELQSILAALMDAQMHMFAFAQSSPPPAYRIQNIRQCSGL